MGRHGDDRAHPRLGSVRDGAQPRGGRAYPQGRRGCLRRSRADRCRLLGARLHARGDPGDDAPLSAHLGLIRVESEADEIGGKPINPGDRIVLFAYGAHHNRLLGGAGGVSPERWMGGGAKKQVKYSYLPFGGGNARASAAP